MWDGVKGSYKCLENVTYDEITSFGVKGVGKEQYKVLCMLLSIVKLKLWKARQGFITGVYKWGEIGTVKAIEKEFEGIYWHELEKWGSDTIKDRWKAFFLNPPKRRW